MTIKSEKMEIDKKVVKIEFQKMEIDKEFAMQVITMLNEKRLNEKRRKNGKPIPI